MNIINISIINQLVIDSKSTQNLHKIYINQHDNQCNNI